MIQADCKTGYLRSSGPVHGMFGLSYAAYYCVPRLALSGMPIWWQKLFVWLVQMMPDTPTYNVNRKDKIGRFVEDEWRNYRHGCVQDLIEK